MNKIVYNNFAPKAAESSAFSAAESSPFLSTANLADEKDPINFASFEGTGINLLDYSLFFADEDDFIGFVSGETSGADKKFPNGGTVLVFNLSGGYYSGPGITLHFYKHSCRDVNIKFYKDSALLFSKNFQPASLDFFCEAPVNGYNKVVMTFISSEIPYQFVKLKGIDFGNVQEITEFYGAINVFEELEPDCSDLPCDTCDFEALIPEEITPQVGQSFYVYHNSQCFGKFTAEKVYDDTGRRFTFEANDDKFTLSKLPFPAIARGTITADSILNTVYESSDISIDNGGFGSTELTGFVQAKDYRYALAMLSMGGGLFVSSARNNKLRLFKLRNRKDTVIGADRILGKAEYIKNAPYTSITLLAHSGSEFNNDTAEKHTAALETVMSNITANELRLDKYSLFSDPAERLNEIASIGFERNEIRAEIILEDEEIGDILSIETSHGLKIGILKSLDIRIQGSEVTANAIFTETEAV